MIRPARIEDIGKIVEMIEADCGEMGYPFNQPYVTEQMTYMIQTKCLIYVMEKESKIVGLLAMLIAPNIFDPSIREMREFIWFADLSLPDFGRARVMVELLDFMLWVARDKNIQVHVALPESKKTESMVELVERRGFKRTEVYFKLEA